LGELLTYDPRQRLSASEALSHNWIKLYDDSDKDIEITCQALVALSKFNAQQKL
jgi:serine/threonine protein kinase